MGSEMCIRDRFQAHMQAAHMLEFSATAKDYFVGRIVHVLQTESNR